MKQFKFVMTALMLTITFGLFAQSPVGNWTYNLPQSDGTTVAVKLTFEENGELHVDVGNDGTVDIEYTYTLSEGSISIKEISSGGDCTGVVGVYEMARIKGGMDSRELNAINDPCELRKVAHDGITLTRVE